MQLLQAKDAWMWTKRRVHDVGAGRGTRFARGTARHTNLGPLHCQKHTRIWDIQTFMYIFLAMAFAAHVRYISPLNGLTHYLKPRLK